MTERKTARISRESGRLVIAAPYDAAFVSEIKASLRSRRWNPGEKVWLIDAAESEKALALVIRFFDIVEKEQPGTMEPPPPAGSSATVDTDITPEWLNRDYLEVWVDGACSGNPGPGGYGIVFKAGDEKKAASGGFRLTTNNRMEILAVILALEALPRKARVIIHSDSRYVVDTMEKGWAKRWKANGWMRNKTEGAVNTDLWERLLGLCERHQVEFKWLRGHNRQVENEQCDSMAHAAAQGMALPPDPGYESHR
jgi:ribonuclease HI